MKTKKMKKVLIALDYDPSSQRIAETGFALATAMGAETILLHVVADETYYSSLDYSPIIGFVGHMEMHLSKIQSVDGLKNASLQFLEKSKQHLGDETIQTLVREGDFADAILKAASDLHVDLIVMGSHSRRWLEELLIGSVTEKVLHHTTIPLFIIPIKSNLTIAK